MTHTTKPVIILVHGLRGNHFGVKEIAKTLEGKYGRKVITPDLPGSGTRPELEDKTLDGYSEWLCKYVKDLKLDTPPIIAGHSLGSIITSYFIEKHPELVDNRVIFLSPIFRSPSARLMNKISYALLSAFLHLMPKNIRYKFMSSKFVSFLISHFLTIDKSKQKEIDRLHYEFSGRFASADSILADTKISMHNETRIPKGKQVFFCLGDHDKLVPLKTSKTRIRASGNKYKVIKNTGHLINYECPKTVARILNNFLVGTED